MTAFWEGVSDKVSCGRGSRWEKAGGWGRCPLILELPLGPPCLAWPPAFTADVP